MKELLHINGGKTLSGEVRVGGAKNSAVALIPAAIITKSIVRLDNVPPIDDVYNLLSILNKIGVKTLYDNKSCLYIDARNVKKRLLDMEEIEKIRASYYFMGAFISLFNSVSIVEQGGCSFCGRPIDIHLDLFGKLGFCVNYNDMLYSLKKKSKRCKEYTFSKKSVGATINGILSCCRIKGKIIFNNCSLEPEIDDLIEFLNKCGAKINRDGEKIIIVGNDNLVGCIHKIIPDRIEAGTYMIIASLMGQHVKIKDININHLESVINVLKDIGVNIKKKGNYLLVSKGNDYRAIDVVVEPYPGFPTDLQQPLSVLLSYCNGKSTIKETVYPLRLSHLESLNDMGANIFCEENLINVNGNRIFKNKNVNGYDLRGGISLVIASLLASGVSNVKGVKYIKRGYSELVYKLKNLGAEIMIVRDEGNEKNIC